MMDKTIITNGIYAVDGSDTDNVSLGFGMKDRGIFHQNHHGHIINDQHGVVE